MCVDKLSPIDRLIYEQQKDICDTCESFAKCRQDLKGYTPVIVHDDVADKYHVGYRLCDKVVGPCNDPVIREERYQAFEAYNKEEILEQIKTGKSIYLHSKVGMGKTHWLMWLSNVYTKKKKSVYVNKVQNAINEFYDKMNDDNKDERNFVRQLQEVDVLCLDDLGNEHATQFTVSGFLFPVIDYRYLHHKPTYITSNYDIPHGLFERYQQSSGVNGQPKVAPETMAPIISRIEDRNIYSVIELKNKNWRKE